MITELRDKEFGILELLFKGFKVFIRNFVPILMIILVIELPISMALELAFPSFKEQTFGEGVNSRRFELYAAILEQPAWMAIIIIVEQYILNGQTNWLLALRKGYSKWGAVFKTGTWAGALAILLFLLFVIPGLIFVVRQYFVLEAVALRNLSGNSALAYSRSLVQGRWWKVFLVLLAILLNQLFLAFILGLLLGIFMLIFPATDFVAGTTGRCIDSFAWYYSLVVGTIFFLNLEYRKN